jgi:hypothetical protein
LEQWRGLAHGLSIYDIVKAKHYAMLQATSYISLIADETLAVDNCSYIVVHVYMPQDWVQIPIILHLQKLESGQIFPIVCSTDLIVVISIG